MTALDALKIGAGVGLAVGIVYLLTKGPGVVAATVGDSIAGVVTGKNSVTAGNPAYDGKGILGTLGAAANAASGGAFQRWGEWSGGKLFDWFGGDGT